MDKRLLFLPTLLLVLAAAAAVAQEKKPAPESRGAAKKVAGVDRDGQPTWAAVNYKLYVKLKNDRTIVGIARDGRLYEKIVYQGKVSPYEKSLQQRYGLTPSNPVTQRFVKAKPTDPGVGIRLWHHDATGGYIFLGYDEIVMVKRLQVISPAELKELDERARRRNAAKKNEIQKKWEEYARKRREALKKALEDKKAGGKPAATGKEKGEPVASAEDQALEALFKRFHPSKGWTPGRKRVIEWRKWTLGTFPSDEEKDFLASFEQWKKAYDQWMTAYAEKESETKPPASEKKPDGK